MSDKKLKEQISQLKKRIETWNLRAEMARKQGSEDLVKTALDEKRKLENELAKIQEHM